MPEANPKGLREYRHDNGDILPFDFIRSARKTIGLYVHRNGSVQVRAPLRVPLAQIYLFLHERWDWLILQRSRFMEEPAPAQVSYTDGETFLHLGHPLMLRVHSASHNLAKRTENELHVSITKDRQEQAGMPMISRGVLDPRKYSQASLSFGNAAKLDGFFPCAWLSVMRR